MEHSFFERLKEFRRELHKNPELSFQETQTKEFIIKHIKDLGLKIEEIGGGLVASLKKGEGKTVALRADMDALPIQDQKKVPHASQNPGVCHACGHDGHMAIVYGAAMLLKEEDFKGEVKFFFQPGEELPPGGALPMVKAGVMEGIDAVFGLHLQPSLALGSVAIKKGPLMAAVDSFTMKIKGKGSHGAMPQEGIDAVVIASHVVLALQAVVSRMTDQTEPLVLTIGKINGGEAFNVIASEIVLEGTVRTVSGGMRDKMPHLMERAAQGVAAAYGGEVEFINKRAYPVLNNHGEAVELVRDVVEKMWGSDKFVILDKPVMGSEDFAYFLEKAFGCYIFLGMDQGEGAIRHNPFFDFDEKILPRGAELLAEVAKKVLSC